MERPTRTHPDVPVHDLRPAKPAAPSASSLTGKQDGWPRRPCRPGAFIYVTEQRLSSARPAKDDGHLAIAKPMPVVFDGLERSVADVFRFAELAGP